MMSRIIADASACPAWALREGPIADDIDRILTGVQLVVPPVWRLEVTNAVLVCERRRRLAPEQGIGVLRSLEALGAVVDAPPEDASPTRLAALARPHQLTAYDAIYLALAVARGLPPLTTDRNLTIAVRRAGVAFVLDRGAPPS